MNALSKFASAVNADQSRSREFFEKAKTLKPIPQGWSAADLEAFSQLSRDQQQELYAIWWPPFIGPSDLRPKYFFTDGKGMNAPDYLDGGSPVRGYWQIDSDYLLRSTREDEDGL